MSEPHAPTPEKDGAPEPPRPEARRRPGRVRRFLVRPFIWGLVLLAAVLVGLYYLIGSRFVAQRFTTFAISQASDFFQRPVRVASLDYSLFPLEVELRGVVIPGPTAADAPWATAELLRIQIPWRYLRQRILRFDQVEAIHPTLFLEFRPDGTTNFPQFRIQGGNGQSRLQVQIGRLLVQRGEFHLNQRRVSFDLAARGVWGRMTGPRPDPADHRNPLNHLEGMATAQEVVTSLPDGKPYPVTASGKVTLLAQRGLLRIESARVSGPDLRASAHGWVGWQGANRVEIQFDATGDARLVNHLGYLDAPLTGPFQATNGRFSLTGEEWSFSGAATAPRVDFLGRTATAVAGRAQGNGRRVHVDVDRATYAGGTAKGKVDVDLLTPTKAGRPVELAFDFRGVSLATALAAEKVPIQGLSGEGTGNFVYRFNSAAILGGSGKATVELAGRYPATGLPVSGTVPLVFERGKLTSQPFQLTAPGQSAMASLAVDLPGESGKIDFQLASQDAGAVMRMIPVDPKAFWNVTAGHGQATGSVAYSKAGLVIDLGLDLTDVRTPDPAIVADTVKGGLRVEPRAVENLKLDLTRGRGKLSVLGRVPIPGDRPKVPLSDPLTLTVDAVDWPAESVVAFLSPGFPVSITGLATGRVDLGGSVESLQGMASGRVANLALQGFPLGQASAGVRFAGTAVQVENGIVEAPAGKAYVQGTFDTAAKTLDFQLEAPALSLAAAPLREQLPGAMGTVALMGAIRGSLDHPAAMLAAHGQGISLAGRSLGDGGKVDLLANWDGATLHGSGALPGLLTLEGGGRLDGKGADLAFDLASDNLPGLARLAAQQPLPAFTGRLAGRVTAAADFSAKTYRAELTLPTLAAQYEERTIANAEPVVVDWTPDRVTLRSFYLRENQSGTELVANGSVGLSGNRPLDLRLQSTLWAGWVKLFAPDLTVDGSVDVLATIRGTVKDPLARGQAELKDARLIVPGFPSAFEKMTGEVFLEGDQIVLNRLTADFAGGVVRASGTLEIPEPGKPLSYRTNLSARGISLRYPEGFVNHGDADLTLTPSEGGGRQLRGTVNLDRIYYLEDVPVATLDLLKRLFQRSRLEATTTNGFLASTQVNIVLSGSVPGALRVHNNVADLHGDVNLVVRGSLARPVVLGSVQIDRGGKLLYADNEYQVERGQLTFDNAYKIDPVIDFLVRTRVRDFDIAVSLSGTLERLSTNFSSNGNLADLEILTLLATGQELSQEERLRALSTPPGQTTTAQQNVSAGTFLAGQAASAIGQRVGTLFGFDRFRINPIAAETGQSVGGVGVTVGKRLSKDVFVTYSTDPTASRQNVLQVEWRISSRVTLLLTQTTNKGYAVDARWEKRF